MTGKIGEGKGLLIIHPPAAKACEAPGGPARLAGALKAGGVACRLWDANLEGQLALMASAAQAASGDSDTWTRRAARHLEANLAALRSPELYAHRDRYGRAVRDTNRLLWAAARPSGVRLNLADYEDGRLNPVRSADLLAAAAEPAANPFHAWFAERLPEILAEMPVSHVGLSINYLSQALTAFAMIGHIRREYPSLRIVLGGGLVTSWMRRPGWRDPFGSLADGMIDGPGEAPLLDLFGKGHAGGFDRPDFDGLPLAGYLAPGAVLPYSASSGCWWQRCSFCPELAEGTPYRPVPPGQAVEDLRALTAKLRPALIHLLDNALSPAI
ncbi:MAG: hypothetical protein LLG93_18310 [Deltaproteobacteria bacterium]|nr:hypothetical protein [Deltaproteobacteria bacterium]